MTLNTCVEDNLFIYTVGLKPRGFKVFKKIIFIKKKHIETIDSLLNYCKSKNATEFTIGDKKYITPAVK